MAPLGPGPFERIQHREMGPKLKWFVKVFPQHDSRHVGEEMVGRASDVSDPLVNGGVWKDARNWWLVWAGPDLVGHTPKSRSDCFGVRQYPIQPFECL